MRMNTSITSFAEYIHNIPEESKPKLLELMAIIKEVVLQAEEGISYGIPTYKYLGGLVAVGATKKHVAFYVMSNSVLNHFENQLMGMDYSTGTIRFKFDAVLPKNLIQEIVKIRIEDNEYLDSQRIVKKK
jgi:uncharacterized protein YdhG (YjbR/CyaY superfamily)